MSSREYCTGNSLRYAERSRLREWYRPSIVLGRLQRGITYAWIKAMSLLTPLMKLLWRRRRWRLNGEAYNYEIHRHNITWANERSVEISYMKRVLEHATDDAVLEVGNVIKRYKPGGWSVCDKYEVEPGIINEDVRFLESEQKYKLILSVSTLEHVGFDEPGHSATGFFDSIERLKALLASGGELHVTVPLGYNRNVDRAIEEEVCGFTQVHFLRRRGLMVWRQVTKAEALAQKYNHPYPCANSIAICILASDQGNATTPELAHLSTTNC